MKERIIELDKELYLYLNNLGDPQWDWFWLFITNKWAAIPLYALLLYFIYRQFGIKGTFITLVCITLLITCTDQLANIFKDGFQRLRPCGQEGVKEFARYIAVRCGKYGYFSAHASSSFGLAVFLGIILKNRYFYLIYFLLFWAILVSFSRIYVGVHYPLDVITGMIIGCILGFLFIFIQRFLLRRFTMTS